MTDEPQPLPEPVGNETGTTEYRVGRGKPPKHTQFGQPGATTKRGSKTKDFTKLRELAVTLGNESATTKGPDGKTTPIIIDDHAVTQIEMLLRTMMRENPARFVEIAFGKVPDEVKISGDPSRPVVVRATQISDDDLAALIANLTTGSGE